MATKTVSRNVAYGLGALLVIQFLWWNKKCPGVLKRGGY